MPSDPPTAAPSLPASIVLLVAKMESAQTPPFKDFFDSIGHVYAFAAARNQVWMLAMNRHSAAKFSHSRKDAHWVTFGRERAKSGGPNELDKNQIQP
jgi:hypothetical protein